MYMSISNKVVALLELGDGFFSADTNVLKTFSYYWTTTTIFTHFIVEDTTIDSEDVIANTLNLLNKYYDNGYRLFLGFSRSSVVSSVLPWFNEHPDSIGMSLSSSAVSLAIPKNIYRLQPPDNEIVNALNEDLNGTNKIYYVYSKNETAAIDVLNYLENTYGENNVVSLAVEPDSSNLLVENIETYFENISNLDVVLIYLFVGNQRETYVNLFNNININANQYDMSLIGMPVINSETTTLHNKYKLILQNSITYSYLYTNGLQYLNTDYSYQALNALQMITTIVNKKSILNMNSYNGVLEFDANKDLKYSSFEIITYADVFVNNEIVSNDPLYGRIKFRKIE